ncbi:hypothetical protein SALBM217S_04242 [Streptomyces griseoloalbus]
MQDAHQGRGVASALLEHIAAVARERDIRRFAAEVLPANTKMIKVFTDAGYTQSLPSRTAWCAWSSASNPPTAPWPCSTRARRGQGPAR